MTPPGKIGFPALATLALCGCVRHDIAAQHPAYVPTPTALERQVLNAVDAGDGDYSIRTLRERVIAHPDDLAARLELGRTYGERGYAELALEHFRLASERFPDSGEAHLLLARTLAGQKQSAEAAEGLAAFLGVHPAQTPEYYSWLGIFRDNSSQWAEGEKAHREAIRLARAADKDKDYLHNNLGWCLLKQGHGGEAAEEFRTALKLNPGSQVARDNLGMAVAENPREAILNWQSVGEPAAAHSNMAALLIEQGKYAEARAEIAQALSYNRFYPAALTNLKLLSDLDGKPAMIELKPAPSLWSRWKTTVHHWFAGTAPEKPAESKQTASR